MKNVSEYQLRIEECLRKAEEVSDPTDRAGWLKLADDWKKLSVSRKRITSDPRQRKPPGAVP